MKNTQAQYGKKNERNLKLVVGLARVSLQEQRRTMRFLSDHGLTLPQFGVLEVLYHKGDLKICEIIEKTLSTSGNMTVIIRNLELDGMVVRIQDPEDKRAQRIRITSLGIDIMDKIFPKHLLELEAWADVLTEAEKDNLIQLLKKLGKRE